MAKKRENDLKRSEPKYPRQRLKITISIPESVNQAYYIRRNRRCLKANVKRWMQRTKSQVMAQMEDQGWKHDDENVWWYFDMVFFFPDRIIRDNHNTFKVMFDAIEGTFFVNDYYALPRVQGCYLDRKNPRLEITISPQTITQAKKFAGGATIEVKNK